MRYCRNYLNQLQFPNLKKNSFRVITIKIRLFEHKYFKIWCYFTFTHRYQVSHGSYYLSYIIQDKSSYWSSKVVINFEKNKCVSSWKLTAWALLTCDLRDHPFKTSANFHDFWTLPPLVGSFFSTICRQIGKMN